MWHMWHIVYSSVPLVFAYGYSNIEYRIFDICSTRSNNHNSRTYNSPLLDQGHTWYSSVPLVLAYGRSFVNPAILTFEYIFDSRRNTGHSNLYRPTAWIGLVVPQTQSSSQLLLSVNLCAFQLKIFVYCNFIDTISLHWQFSNVCLFRFVLF